MATHFPRNLSEIEPTSKINGLHAIRLSNLSRKPWFLPKYLKASFFSPSKTRLLGWESLFVFFARHCSGTRSFPFADVLLTTWRVQKKESQSPTIQLQNPNFIKLQNETCSVFGVFASTGSPLETGAYPGSGGAAERFFWHEDSRFLRALSYGIFTTFQTRFGPGELRRSWWNLTTAVKPTKVMVLT